MTVTTTPPPLQAPTAKEKKYDRQLRLWAASGQRALEESHILLLIADRDGAGSGSSVAGVETLKNLVLPGIGSFTIADSAKVTEADLGVNFFLEAESLGRSRADECRRLLEELNPDVSGHAVSAKLDDWLTDAAALRPYNLILLCAPFPSRPRSAICQYAQEHSVPVIYIHSVGFYSAFSVQVPFEYPIVDTHPDPDSTQDLRLLAPWRELLAEVSSLGDITSLNDHDHGHIPYVLLLLHYLEAWKASHSGNIPETFKEKTQFRDLVRSGARTDNPEGGEENFDEAAGAVLKTITYPMIGSGCKDMFEMDSCTNLRPHSANFWITAAAIKAFYKQHGVLPLPGSLPDMKARSADYIQLQNIYKSKARNDRRAVLQTVRTHEKELGRGTEVSEAEVEAFCKNAPHVKVVTGTSLPQLRVVERSTQARLAAELGNEDSLTAIFLVLAAQDLQAGLGDTDISLQGFFSRHWSISESEMPDLETILDVEQEISRAGGGEMHNISSITGGMVAQEAIKIITRQYVPVDNTCIFDGIKGRTEVVRL